jgi:diguanylate cyclase (GGDEF)-like protein
MLKSGEMLLAAGRPNRKMYLILSGRLSVHLDSKKSKPVALLQAGQTVGEMSVLDGSPVSAFVVATESTRLIELDEDTFWRLVNASHEFAKNLLFLLAQRIRASNVTISESSRLQSQFARDALFDPLTGLNNRRWLEAKLPRLIKRYQYSGQSLTVLMIDVDHFKRFNDAYGHLAGDIVLSTLGQVLQEQLRPTDLSVRYGGEEFVVILPSADLAGARIAAERLREAVNKAPISTQQGASLPSVTISIGIAQLSGDENADSVLARADVALYRAKKLGRNRVETEIPYR